MKSKTKLVHGVGINDADYVIQPTINGRRVMCQFYRAWKGMLERCYSAKYQAKHPTYIGCSVTPDWLVLSRFKEWMEAQDWNGRHLDKDLLVPGNKIYSPDTCAFVSQSHNNLLNDHGSARGEFAIGVSWCKRKRKFKSHVNDNGKLKWLGFFATEAEAHNAWKKAKSQIIAEAAASCDDSRVAAALLRRAKELS